MTGFQNKTHFMGKSALMAVALLTASASLAQGKRSKPVASEMTVSSSSSPLTSSYSSSSYEGESSHKKIGFGVKRFTTTGGVAAWGLHGMMDLGNSLWVGAGFGFEKQFDGILFAGDVRKGIAQSGPTLLFGEGSVGFLKSGSKSNFIGGARIGFQYALSEKLKIDSTYGLEFCFGDGTDHFGMTQPTDFAGSFGVHWFF